MLAYPRRFIIHFLQDIKVIAFLKIQEQRRTSSRWQQCRWRCSVDNGGASDQAKGYFHNQNTSSRRSSQARRIQGTRNLRVSVELVKWLHNRVLLQKLTTKDLVYVRSSSSIHVRKSRKSLATSRCRPYKHGMKHQLYNGCDSNSCFLFMQILDLVQLAGQYKMVKKGANEGE